MENRIYSFVFCALMLGGCGEYALDMGSKDSANEQGHYTDSDVVDFLRVDVYPSNFNEDLLPETHILPSEGWNDVKIAMSTPVTVSGSITGWNANPWLSAVTVPGTETPVLARISAVVPDTIMSGVAWSDPETGAFDFRVPGNSDYLVTVVPETTEPLPFFVADSQSLVRTTDYPVDLGYGVPVYGNVSQGDGEPVPDIKVTAIDWWTGAEGQSVITNERGDYVLRTLPGDYRIRFAGSEGTSVPALYQTVTVGDDDEGLVVDAAYGPMEPVVVEGFVLDSESVAFDNVTVRFTSQSLVGQTDASLVVETDTDRYGRYSARLLEGTYIAEFVPLYEDAATPVEQYIEVPAGYPVITLSSVELEPFRTVEARVVDKSLAGIADAVVTAKVLGFDGFTYSTTTSDNGSFSFDVPGCELDFTFSPPEGALAAVTFKSYLDGDLPEGMIVLLQGEQVQGSVVHNDEPVANALVKIRDVEDNLYATTITDEDGAFAVWVNWEGK